jgi:catalase
MRRTVIENVAGGLGKCRKDIQERMIPHFYKIDHEYGAGIAEKIGLPVMKAKL